jgi:hypothetical protein
MAVSGRDLPSGPGINVRFSPLAYALDDEGASGRVVDPARQDLLVFGQTVPAFDRLFVGEFEDDDPFRLRFAFDQIGRAAPCLEYAIQPRILL